MLAPDEAGRVLRRGMRQLHRTLPAADRARRARACACTTDLLRCGRVLHNAGDGLRQSGQRAQFALSAAHREPRPPRRGLRRRHVPVPARAGLVGLLRRAEHRCGGHAFPIAMCVHRGAGGQFTSRCDIRGRVRHRRGRGARAAGQARRRPDGALPLLRQRPHELAGVERVCGLVRARRRQRRRCAVALQAAHGRPGASRRSLNQRTDDLELRARKPGGLCDRRGLCARSGGPSHPYVHRVRQADARAAARGG